MIGWLLMALSLAAPAAEMPRLEVRGAGFVAADQPVGLAGVNLYQSHMMWARQQNVAEAREAVSQVAAQGFNFVRLPLSFGFLMPAPDILPDHPDYAATLARHGLKPGYLPLLDAVLDEAAKHRVWVMAEFHEFPTDPYRWFTGGDEQQRGTDQPGGGIAWMKDPATIRRQVPGVLGWLARRWRGRAALAGFEVPYNEPHGDAPYVRGDAFREFVAECGQAVKQADARHLVFLAVGDYGAAINEIPGSFVWDLPPEVDALTPHFYLGMHNKSATVQDAYGVVPASWLSWFRGAGKPIVIGEYGPAHAAYRTWQTYDDSDQIVQRLHDACLAGWLLNGAQGAVRWAWDRGVDDPGKRGAIAGQSAALRKYLAPCIARPRQGRGAVGIVLDPSRRASYGQPKDLLRVAAALLNVGAAPFDCLFADQVLAQPEVLKAYRAVLVYRPGLSPAARAAAAAAGVPSLELADDAVADDLLRDFLRGAGVTVDAAPRAIWAFESEGRLALFNRTGEAAAYSHPVWDWQRAVNLASGEALAVTDGLTRIELPPFGGADLALLGPGQEAPRAEAAARPRPATDLPLLLPLYDHGPARGRWVSGWAGGQALLGRAEDGREVVTVITRSRLEAGGLNFDRHQPVELGPWRQLPGATLELQLRLVERGPAALEIELHGDSDVATSSLSIRPSSDWQTVSVPLDRFAPATRPKLMTGVFLRFLPEGSGQLGAAWLARPAQ